MAEPSKVVKSVARKPPAAGMGRKKGVPNRTTGVLKDAVLLAAELEGNDGKGKDGLTGYLRHIAATDVKAFAGLIGKVLPLQINANVNVSDSTKEQRDAAVAAFTRSDR